MCGIFGLACTDAAAWPARDRHRLVENLFKLSQSRGREAAGLAVLRDGVLRVHRAPVSAERMWSGSGMRDFLDWAFAREAKGAWACLGHARLATNGSEGEAVNNQPICSGTAALVHNGIVVNDAQLWALMPSQRREGEVDSEALLKYALDLQARGASAEEAWQTVFGTLEGTASVGVLDARNLSLGWFTNFGSLYAARRGDSWVFASEHPILAKALRASFRGQASTQSEIQALASGQGLSLDLSTGTANPVALPPAPKLSPTDRRIARSDRNVELPALRRCTRCILPETMPFIRFDADGVCQWCREHSPLALQGETAFEAHLASYRSRDGRPDCLVAFSGGRDSCYGLHLLKRNWGMHPVAFTYDWGMVTDLARRNQARMCGALGVEHILVADDMREKRRHIRLNLEAWLRKPHLGMLPLLTAGDKHFFTHANRIGRELGIRLIVFFENPYEQTLFKTGFLGVEEPAGRVYDLRLFQRGQLAFKYACEFLRNPGYLNASLFDSLRAFAASYGRKHPYLFPFRYLPWREPEVDAVLLQDYGWETSPDSASTWRIGDGTAAFYNFVYFTVAGFTEFDTFRSHQIREGLITREAALAAVARENQPRWESLREYLHRIGIDEAKALQVIRAMPKRFQVGSR